MPVTRIDKNFVCDMGGGGADTNRREGRSEEKAEGKRREDRRWLANYPMGMIVSDSVRHKAELVDAETDAEVDLRLPLRDPKLQDRPQEEISTHSGVLDQAAIDLDEHRRLTPPNGAKPKSSGHGVSLPLAMNARDHMRGWQGPTWAVVDMERPAQIIRDLPKAGSELGLTCRLVFSSVRLRTCRARRIRCPWAGNSLSPGQETV